MNMVRFYSEAEGDDLNLLLTQVNYNDGGTVDRPEDTTWQENLSDYNSDFSAPSGNSFHYKVIVVN